MKTEEKQNIMNNNNTEAMKATTIAHLVGRMDAILKIIEFDVQEIAGNEYLKKYLMSQINEAKDVNEKIFEMYIEKTYSDENK